MLTIWKKRGIIGTMQARSRVTNDEALNAAVVDAWLATQASLNTRAAYRADLEAFGRWCARQGTIPLRADTATVAAFHTARQAAEDSASTLRRRLSALSSFYQFAIDAQAADSNPISGTSRPKTSASDPSPTTVLTAGCVDEYLALASALDPRLEALVALLVFDGLKVGEALALDVDDVTGRPPKVSLVIRRRGSARRITLDAGSARAVYRCAGRRKGEPLFTSARPAEEGSASRRLTRFGADHLIRQLTTDDRKRVTANALRRFHITAGHTAGDDLDDVRERAGLADIRSLRRYLVEPETTAAHRPVPH